MGGPSDIEIRLFDPVNAPAGQWAALHAFRRERHAESSPGDPLAAATGRTGSERPRQER